MKDKLRMGAISPEDRIPSEVKGLIGDAGLPDFYEGPLYTGRNGAKRALEDVERLTAHEVHVSASGEIDLEAEVAPLPFGIGERADRE